MIHELIGEATKSTNTSSTHGLYSFFCTVHIPIGLSAWGSDTKTSNRVMCEYVLKTFVYPQRYLALGGIEHPSDVYNTIMPVDLSIV